MAETSPAIEVDPKLLEEETTDYSTAGFNTETTSLSSTVAEYVFENGPAPRAFIPVSENSSTNMSQAVDIILTSE
jgi:hypothetical protein